MSILKLSLICFFAIILNILSTLLFSRLLHLPLFMDTIFSIAVLFYAGLLPALLVQISYNIINSFIWTLRLGTFDIFIPMYTFCGIFIVLSSYFIIRYDNDSPASRELTLLYLILIALISTIFTVLMTD